MLFKHFQDSRSAIVTQLCHTSASLGGVISCLYYGATCVFPHPVFDGQKALEGIIKER